MIKELPSIQHFLIDLLKSQQPILKIVHDNEDKFEVAGTIPAMQGRKKVDGFHFATIMPKPKDIRLYFFPVYTHADPLAEGLSDELRKCLKGKNCFHIKSISDDMAEELRELVSRSISLYQKDGLLAKS